MDKDKLELHDTLGNLTTLAVIGVVGYVGYKVWPSLQAWLKSLSDTMKGVAGLSKGQQENLPFQMPILIGNHFTYGQPSISPPEPALGDTVVITCPITGRDQDTLVTVEVQVYEGSLNFWHGDRLDKIVSDAVTIPAGQEVDVSVAHTVPTTAAEGRKDIGVVCLIDGKPADAGMEFDDAFYASGPSGYSPTAWDYGSMDFGETEVPILTSEPKLNIPISTYVLPPALTYQTPTGEIVHNYNLEVRTDPDMGQGAVEVSPRMDTYPGGTDVTLSLVLFWGQADYWLVEQEGQAAYQVFGQNPTITIQGNTRVTAHIV